jgi:hypothetical protein
VTSESTLGWAFLVARGHRTGYQLLLVPDFIVATGEAALLMDEIQGEVPTQGPPIVADIVGPISGPLCVVYRTIRATRGDIGAADRLEEPLLDRAGRPLVLAYGFVWRGSRMVAPHEEDLRVARDAAVATYRRFHAAEETFLPETSRPYVVRSTVAPVEVAVSGSAAPPASDVAAPWPGVSRSPVPWTSQVLPGSQQPAPARHRPAIVIPLIVALVLLVLAVGAYVLMRGGHAPQVKVPNVVKMEMGDAKQRIAKAHLIPKVNCPKTKPSGASINSWVISTKPQAYKWVDKNSKVFILVSPCPHPVNRATPSPKLP